MVFQQRQKLHVRDVVQSIKTFFPNNKILQVANWQIATDRLIAIIKAQRQNFPQGFTLGISATY